MRIGKLIKTNSSLKSIITIVVTIGLALICSGCSRGEFDPEDLIEVVSREDGSGTRGAFVEIFEVIAKDNAGKRKDMTTKEAVIAKQTDVMISAISSNAAAIGYISLGSLNDTVEAVKINGAKPTKENVKNGNYTVSRPFNIVTKGNASAPAKDFIDYIMSKEGQKIISESYIEVNDVAMPYNGTKPEGKIVIVGSSSVSPIMEKLKEAYLVINPKVNIEIQTSDSSAGITAAIDGTCDIGMSSRDLKDEESKVLTKTQIAIDGIVVIINKKNPNSDLSADQIKSIFTGETMLWDEIV